MALQELVGEIDKDSEAEERRIMAEAEAQATQIIREANAATVKIGQQADLEAQELCSAEERKLSSARLRGRQLTSQAKSEVIQAAIAALGDQLAALASARDKARRAEYERVFGRLAREGLKQVPAPAVIHCRKEDAGLAAKFGTVSKEFVSSTGGLVVSSADGKVRVDNTFPAILEEKSEQLTQVAHQVLFSGRTPAEPAGKKARRKPAARPSIKKAAGKAKPRAGKKTGRRARRK